MVLLALRFCALGRPKGVRIPLGLPIQINNGHYSARLGAAKLTFPEITRFERGRRCLVMLSLIVLPFALSAVDGYAQNVVQVDGTQGGQCSTNGGTRGAGMAGGSLAANDGWSQESVPLFVAHHFCLPMPREWRPLPRFPR
jgi:hypothetical protein